MKRSKQSTVVGLDIGVSSVKRVDIIREDKSIRLERVSVLPLADPTPEALKKVLRTLFEPPKGVSPKAAKKLFKHVRISITGPSILIRRVTLPLMSRIELKGAIRFEAENHVPFPIDDCALDFQILSESIPEKTMSVLLVAAKKDYIEERLRILSEFYIFPELVDVDIFCLANAFEILGERSEHKTYGLMNIGHESTSFTIIRDKQPYYVRDVSLGSKEITKFIMETKGMDEAQAEEFKTTRPAADALTNPETLDALKTATQKGYEALTEEIRTSISYYEEEVGESLAQIWMSGGGSMAHGAAEVFAEALGKSVQTWDNTKKLEIFKDVDQAFLTSRAPELNIALGLALRDLTGSSS